MIDLCVHQQNLNTDPFGLKCQNVLSQFPHFCLLQTIFKKNKTYIVGGALRDIFFENSFVDLDLISEKNPSHMARDFANKTEGCWFWLDEKRMQSRVILDVGFGQITYDFSPFRASTLLDDLKDRDFTVNAMTVPLNLPCKLIDPLGGYNDLLKKTLRVITPEALQHDPVRILKGIRHAVTLNLSLESQTRDLMFASHSEIASSAPERIRQEFWKIMASKQLKKGMLLIEQIGLGQDFFGPNFKKALPEILDIIQSSSLNWEKMCENQPRLNGCLAIDSEYGLNYKGLILFSMITSKVDPLLPRQMSNKWRLSRKTTKRLEAMSSLNQRVFDEIGHVALNRRAFYFWAAKYQLSVIHFFLALTALSKGPKSKEFKTLQDFLNVIDLDDQYKPKDYVNGKWIKENLYLEEGMDIKKAIQLLRNAEISGQVNSVDQARNFLFNRYLIND